MSYDGRLMRQALARFDEDKQRRAENFRARERAVYTKCPRIEEIDRELELMELVKAHYFDGIRNANTSPDDIQTDLHAFQEAYLNDDGELVWVYNYKDVTGKGIAPSEMDGWLAAEQ